MRSNLEGFVLVFAISVYLLAILNIVIQALDWITSFVAYMRGWSEGDPFTIRLINLFGGNPYLGVSIEKVAYILLFLGGVFVFRRVRARSFKVGVIVGVTMVALMFYGAVEVLPAVSRNFQFLGW